MHLYFVTRGPKYIRDHWVSHMQAQPFYWNRKNLKTGKDEKMLVQGNLKPIELWEYVIPEEHINEVSHYLGFDPNGKHCHKKQLEPLAMAMRKLLKLKKVPKWNDNELAVMPRLLNGARSGFSIYPIGIKKDLVKEFPQWGYEQEGL